MLVACRRNTVWCWWEIFVLDDDRLLLLGHTTERNKEQQRRITGVGTGRGEKNRVSGGGGMTSVTNKVRLVGKN